MPTDRDTADHDAIVRLVATLCATRLIGLPINADGEVTQPLDARHLTSEEIGRIGRQMDMLLHTLCRASSIRYKVYRVGRTMPDWIDNWLLRSVMPHHPKFLIGLTKNGRFDLSISREWHGSPQQLFSGEGLTLSEIAMHIAVTIYGSPEGHDLIRTEDIPGFWELHATCAPRYVRRPELHDVDPA